MSDAVIEARNKKEEDVENKDMETELSPAEDEKQKMLNELHQFVEDLRPYTNEIQTLFLPPVSDRGSEDQGINTQ